MSLKQVQDSIKLSLRVINKALKQVPNDKRTMLMSRVNGVLGKYMKPQHGQNQESLKKFLKQLQFNVNFIKLSHPNLDYNPETDPQPTAQKTQNITPQSKFTNPHDNPTNNNTNPTKQQPDPHKFKLYSSQGIQLERMPGQDVQDQQLEIEKSARTEVQFSNWFDGNVDPQQLRRHKNLLERQHFKGDYWEEKPKPQNYAKACLESLIASKTKDGQPLQQSKKDQNLQDYKPQYIDADDDYWQKVQR